MAPFEGDGQFTWDLYAQPGLLSLSAKIALDDREWVLLTLQTETESEDGVALSPDFLCPECGYQRQEQDEDSVISDSENDAITLKLKIEELPRLVAVLNEAYRAVTSKLTVIPGFDKSGEWGEREWQLGNLRVVEPLARREPESRTEDWKDRIAVLRAYEVISARLSDDARKVGLLQPIG